MGIWIHPLRNMQDRSFYSFDLCHKQGRPLELPPKRHPHLLAGNPQKFANIAELLGENNTGLSDEEAGAKSILAVRKLIDQVKLPKSMRDVGIKEDDIETMTKHSFESNSMLMKMWTIRDVTESDISIIFHSSF